MELAELSLFTMFTRSASEYNLLKCRCISQYFFSYHLQFFFTYMGVISFN